MSAKRRTMRLSDKYEDLPGVLVRRCQSGTVEMIDSKTRGVVKLALIALVTDDGVTHDFAIRMEGAQFLADQLREVVVEEALLANDSSSK